MGAIAPILILSGLRDKKGVRSLISYFIIILLVSLSCVLAGCPSSKKDMSTSEIVDDVVSESINGQCTVSGMEDEDHVVIKTDSEDTHTEMKDDLYIDEDEEEEEDFPC